MKLKKKSKNNKNKSVFPKTHEPVLIVPEKERLGMKAAKWKGRAVVKLQGCNHRSQKVQITVHTTQLITQQTHASNREIEQYCTRTHHIPTQNNDNTTTDTCIQPKNITTHQHHT